MAKTGDETHISFSNEISALRNKIRNLEENLKEQIYQYKDLEKQKLSLEKTNDQIMQDYKFDLETLKQNVKSKAKEDEAVFKRVLDEKGKSLFFSKIVAKSKL